MNRIEAYQNAFFCMTVLIAKNVGTIHTLDVYPHSVMMSIHISRPQYVVYDVVDMIKPYFQGSPKVSVSPVPDDSYNVLHINWDAYDE